MKVRLLFFAALRERAGTTDAERELAGSPTVGELWQALRRDHPALAAYRGPVKFAVNQEYVDSEHPLQDNDEVAFIPPVSGGAPMSAGSKHFLPKAGFAAAADDD